MPPPKRLIIDASVAIAAGETNHPTSHLCREFLEAVVTNQHRLVMTREIEAEWKNTEKARAYRWLRRFYAKKQVDYLDEAVLDEALRERILDTAVSDKRRVAMHEELHLTAAAIITDKIVSSLDQAVRQHFTDAAAVVVEIRAILWLNPSREPEQAVLWVSAGCPADKPRQLGYRETGE